MKVRCIAVLDGGSAEFSPWLTLGKEYHVLSIERDASGKTWFRILTSEESAGVESLGLHSADSFEVISRYRPSSWRDRQLNGEVDISPAAWQVDGFWEDLYGGDASVEMAFERERDLIFSEEP